MVVITALKSETGSHNDLLSAEDSVYLRRNSFMAHRGY